MRRHNRRIPLLAAMCALVLTLGYLPGAQAAMPVAAPLTYGNTQNGMVRVCLASLGNPSTLKLTVQGSYTVNGSSSRTLQSGSAVTVNFNKTTGRLSLTSGGSTADMGTSFKLRRHAASGDNGLKIAQGRAPANLYPGDFQFTVRSSGGSYKLYVIAYIYMEDYLYGVLPYEMGNSSGLEALKAQAVAARTYTMRAMSAASSSLYDVVDTTSDQVYSGTPSGNANCKAAVDATKGIVLKYGNAFTATYYTASNGGQTESVKNAWGSSTYPYLTVKDDPYDLANTASRKNSFTVNASGSQSNGTLGKLLNQKAAARFGSGATVTAVSAVTPHTPKYASPSRLYTKLDFQVTYSLNGSVGTGTLTFDIFSELEGPLGMGINSGNNELWSVSQTSSGFTVTARRYGHGIGMSQRGAMYMAQMGYSYAQILGFYFEGCTQVQYTLTRSILSPVVEGEDSHEEVIPEDPADIPSAGNGTAAVRPQNGSSLPLRYAANEGAFLLANLPSGALVDVYQEAGGYYLVGYGSLCGYALKSGLVLTGGIAYDASKAPTALYGHGTVVHSNALNLRAAPSMSGSVLTTVPGGTVLPVFHLSGNWAAVQYGLRTGYVSLDYLQLDAAGTYPAAPTEAPAQPPSAACQQARVTTEKGSLNLRATPSDSARVLLTIPQYAVIDIYERGSAWCKTAYNETTGYVMTKFLTFLSPGAGSATPAPTQAPVQPPSGNENVWQYAKVTTASGSLNLRATMNGKVLRTIPQNEVIPVMERLGAWCKVSYGGYTGFVMTQYLTFLGASSPTASPTAAPTPARAPAAQDSRAMVTTEKGSLNLRERASDSARVLRTIPQYEIVTVLQAGADWCRVSYGSSVGYVMTKFLTFLQGGAATPDKTPASQPAPTPSPTQAPFTGQVAAYATVHTGSGSLNLRAAPGGNTAVYCTIPQHTLLPVLQRGSQWCMVSYNGYTGYVMTQYLAFAEEEAKAPDSSAPNDQRDSTLRPLQIPVGGLVVCPSSSLNLRAGCSTSADILLEIPKNDYVIITEAGKTWCKVEYEDRTGYCMTQYLEFTLYE